MATYSEVYRQLDFALYFPAFEHFYNENEFIMEHAMRVRVVEYIVGINGLESIFNILHEKERLVEIFLQVYLENEKIANNLLKEIVAAFPEGPQSAMPHCWVLLMPDSQSKLKKLWPANECPCTFPIIMDKGLINELAKCFNKIEEIEILLDYINYPPMHRRQYPQSGSGCHSFWYSTIKDIIEQGIIEDEKAFCLLLNNALRHRPGNRVFQNFINKYCQNIN